MTEEKTICWRWCDPLQNSGEFARWSHCWVWNAIGWTPFRGWDKSKFAWLAEIVFGACRVHTKRCSWLDIYTCFLYHFLDKCCAFSLFHGHSSLSMFQIKRLNLCPFELLKWLDPNFWGWGLASRCCKTFGGSGPLALFSALDFSHVCFFILQKTIACDSYSILGAQEQAFNPEERTEAA